MHSDSRDLHPCYRIGGLSMVQQEAVYQDALALLLSLALVSLESRGDPPTDLGALILFHSLSVTLMGLFRKCQT